MGFRTTNRYRAVASSIAAKASAQPAETKTVLEEKLAPFLKEGEAMPDAGLLQELLGRFLAAQGDALVAADDVYQAEILQHRLLAQAMKSAMKELRRELRVFRAVVENNWGEERCQLALGTRSFTTRDPGILAGLGRQAAQVLKQPAFAFEPNAVGSSGFDSQGLSELLESKAQEVQRLAGDVQGRIKVRRQTEQGNKDEALAATKTAISEAAALLKGLFVFSGKSNLARRMQPSHRKKGNSRPVAPLSVEP